MHDPKKSSKILHLRTITQLCRAISSQLKHVSTIGKKLVKQQYLLHMPSQHGELRPSNGWDRFGSLGHTSKFQRVSVLGSVTARHFSTGRQRSFAALNRGRHLYSAGRSSRLALTHIVVLFSFADLTQFGVTPEDKAVKQKPTVLVTPKELTCWSLESSGSVRWRL